MTNKLIIITPFFITCLIALLAVAGSDEVCLPDSCLFKNHEDSRYFFPYLKEKDTIYYLGKTYVKLSLKEQKVYIISRNDTARVFKISSGNENISKGKNTPEGLFTVQSKNPLAISKQFDNAELFNWIGFNGNVGFHGLKGTKYYWSLGIRPSSHGCVRISREDGQKLYERVKLGTPVYVYHDEPARIIKFASMSEFNPETDEIIYGKSDYYLKVTNNRLKNLYKGFALRKNRGKIFLDGDFVLRRGLDIGTADLIPQSQKLPVSGSLIKYLSKDNTDLHPNRYLITDKLPI